MVKKLMMFDNFDHSVEATETIPFAYRGKSYEIDLSEEHAAEFDELMARYIEHAEKLPTKVASKPKTSSKPKSSTPPVSATPLPQRPKSVPTQSEHEDNEPQLTEAVAEDDPIPHVPGIRPVKGKEWWVGKRAKPLRMAVRRWAERQTDEKGNPRWRLVDRGRMPADLYDAWYDQVYAPATESNVRPFRSRASEQ